MGKLLILIAAGAIAYNGTLEDVHNRRVNLYGQNIPVDGFACRVGVQHRYKDLIGQRVGFYDVENERAFLGLLVVDTASDKHAGIMESNHIALDSDCDALVHRAGFVFLYDSQNYRHPDSVWLNHDAGFISRVKYIMLGNHRLCGANVACHWRLRKWAIDR